MRQTIISIVVVAILIVIGIFAYQFLAGTTSDQISEEDFALEEKLNEYRAIKTLKPDLSIFSDPFFKSLSSPSQSAGVSAKPTITSGRINPFIPF